MLQEQEAGIKNTSLTGIGGDGLRKWAYHVSFSPNASLLLLHLPFETVGNKDKNGGVLSSFAPASPPPQSRKVPDNHPSHPWRQGWQPNPAREPALPKLSAAFTNNKIKAGPASPVQFLPQPLAPFTTSALGKENQMRSYGQN